MFDLALDDATTVRIAHSAETEFGGARAGLLDQLASVYGRRDEALLIDMRDYAMRRVPLPPAAELAVIDSGTRHAHATGASQRPAAWPLQEPGVPDPMEPPRAVVLRGEDRFRRGRAQSRTLRAGRL